MPNEGYGNAGFQFCQNLLEIKRIEDDLNRKYNSLKKQIAETLKLLGGGLAGLADIVGAEIIAAAGELASSIVSTVAGAASAAVAAALEAILSQLLTILLSGPEALLSLLALPLKKAHDATVSERNYIFKAKTNLSNILRILSKWLGGFGGERYYQQIKNAIPFLEQSLIDITSMINDLDVNQDESTVSPYFNTDIYNRIISNLNTAIDITEPESILSLGLGQNFEQQKVKYQQTHLRELREDWYIPIRNRINKTREDAINKITPSTSRNVIVNELFERRHKLKLAQIDTKWEYDTKIHNEEYKQRQEIVRASSVESIAGVSLKEALKQSRDKQSTEFKADILQLTENLASMGRNIRDAYIENKKSQLFTNSSYHAVNKIKDFIKWFIEAARKAGGGASEVAIEALNGAGIIIGQVRDEFQDDKNRYQQDNISTSEMSVDIVMGNAQLKIADSFMSGLITSSLIELINLDEFFGEEQEKFERFRKRIDLIPDWDERLGVWGVDLENTAITPYISLTVSIAKLVGLAPIALTSSTKSAKENFNKDLRKIDSEFTKLLNHNTTVLTTLSSYTPYQSDQANAIKRYLDAIGFSYLSYAFTALSITAWTSGIVDGIYSFADQANNCMQNSAVIENMSQDKQDDLNNAIISEKKTVDSNINRESANYRSETTREFKEEKDRAESLNIVNYVNSGIRNINGIDPNSNTIATEESRYGTD